MQVVVRGIVNRSMTPTGVEHMLGMVTAAYSRGVNRSMTPTGVEHQNGDDLLTLRDDGEPINDADRR